MDSVIAAPSASTLPCIDDVRGSEEDPRPLVFFRVHKEVLKYHVYNKDGEVLEVISAITGRDHNGVVFGPPWPILERGDFIEQLIMSGDGTKNSMPWYKEPSAAVKPRGNEHMHKITHKGAKQGTILGPVHQTHDELGIFWVLVPIPLELWREAATGIRDEDAKRLVWVAVAKRCISPDGNGISIRHYAQMIPRERVHAWTRKGWVTTFFDDPEWATGTLGALKATCKALAAQLVELFDFNPVKGRFQGNPGPSPPERQGDSMLSEALARHDPHMHILNGASSQPNLCGLCCPWARWRSLCRRFPLPVVMRCHECRKVFLIPTEDADDIVTLTGVLAQIAITDFSITCKKTPWCKCGFCVARARGTRLGHNFNPFQGEGGTPIATMLLCSGGGWRRWTAEPWLRQRAHAWAALKIEVWSRLDRIQKIDEAQNERAAQIYTQGIATPGPQRRRREGGCAQVWEVFDPNRVVTQKGGVGRRERTFIFRCRVCCTLQEPMQISARSLLNVCTSCLDFTRQFAGDMNIGHLTAIALRSDDPSSNITESDIPCSRCGLGTRVVTTMGCSTIRFCTDTFCGYSWVWPNDACLVPALRWNAGMPAADVQFTVVLSRNRL